MNVVMSEDMCECVLTILYAAAATAFIRDSMCNRLQSLSVIRNGNICNTVQEEDHFPFWLTRFGPVCVCVCGV